MIGKQNKGITLIELLVGIACFSIVVALVTGIFVTALSAKKQVKELSVLQDEARYIMDYMAREIRTAEINNSTGVSDTLSIKDGSVTYKFENNQITRNTEALNTVSISGSFDVDASDQPKVTINMTLTKNNNSIRVQTTISSRYYE